MTLKTKKHSEAYMVAFAVLLAVVIMPIVKWLILISVGG